MELLGLTRAELENLAEKLGEKPYRGRQLAEWIYKKGADRFDMMTNLPAPFRTKLSEETSLTHADVIARKASPDGTAKFALLLADSSIIECVFIPYPDRITACVSTQVGCAAGCSFCATAEAGFTRNLTAGEIIDQVITIQKETVCRVTNVVFMGMGEPMLNYDNVLRAINILNKEMGIGMRKMTISTVGITPRIRRLAEEKLQITLAISLHAPTQQLREKIIPYSKRYPLKELIQACREYSEITGRRVTYEYLLIAGLNDSPKHAEKLASLIGGTLSNINLIPYNLVEGKDFRRPDERTIEAFKAILMRRGIEAVEREERGHSAAAACGQLRGDIVNKRR